MNKNKNGIPKVTKTHRNTFRPVERPVHNEKVLDGPYKSFDLMRGTRMVEMVYKAVNTVTASFIMPYNRKKVDEYKLDGWSISNVWNNE